MLQSRPLQAPKSLTRKSLVTAPSAPSASLMESFSLPVTHDSILAWLISSARPNCASMIRRDHDAEFLSRFLGIAFEDCLAGNGIMQIGLNILQELARFSGCTLNRHLQLTSGKVGDFPRDPAEPILGSGRFNQAGSDIFHRSALDHGQLVSQPLGILRVHLRELLNKVEKDAFPRLAFRKRQVDKIANPIGRTRFQLRCG